MAGKANHDYHILEPDIWPLIGSVSALTFTSGMVLIPFIFGIGIIFYNARNFLGWLLAGGSLVALMEEGFRTHATRNAYAYMDRFFTFADIDRYSAAFAAWLQSQRPGWCILVLDALRPQRVQEAIWREVAGTPEALYLVVETKGYDTATEIPEREQWKIQSARSFFEALKARGTPVKYETKINHQHLAQLIDGLTA